MICTNKTCKWNKAGACVLFIGVRCLECKYRTTGETKKTKKSKTIKKGK